MTIVSKVCFAESVPKDGLSVEQCEDQFNVASNRLAFAVSDGATHSLFARYWAKCLVDHFCDSPSVEISQEWLRPAAVRFFASLDTRSLPWHALEKLTQGAFATLAAIVLSAESPIIDGVVVGDSCILLVTPGSEPVFFPSIHHNDFRLDPNLLSTLETNNGVSINSAQRLGPRELPTGQTFVILMTDAVAHWYLSQASRLGIEEPFDRLFCCPNREAFELLVREARANDGMKNDDCTLIIIELYRA
jgi:hypothetical protein